MIDAPNSHRMEVDSLGLVAVPSAAYFGSQTARAIENFPISGVPVSRFPELIRALAHVKKAACLANKELGLLSPEKAAAVVLSCDEVAAGQFDTEFPIDVFQGGAGTSTNMNINEVVANRALERLGFARARYDVIHPNDDVNRSQSTNDVYPTAIRLAILSRSLVLRSALEDLSQAMQERSVAFWHIDKLGRTQLQDAVPMTLGQEFLAYAVTIKEDVRRLSEASALLCEINLGGTAIGTGINADPSYKALALSHLHRITGLELIAAENLVEATWDTGAFVSFSGTLKRIATKLSKIANDLRLLSSGPRGGLAEINLPALQAGSSIMPGKVNPVIPEVINQVAFQVIGADLTVTLASEAGQLQLNVMEPVIAYNILNAQDLLINAVTVFTQRCISKITANPEQCLKHLEASTAAATALVPILGYEQAADIAREAISSGRSIRSVIEGLPGLPADFVPRSCELLPLTGASGRSDFDPAQCSFETEG
ncbi:aspartate ammonia-lyase [Mesorhizobium sp.]|uniref:aspartate ammonia-lyase n=1 Tax=Mesorhizobium sp. TaxID=1871066 RepID=UPI000FE8D68D|nr:aspartate ammonia-lyase [Mesorhizobium sp.]RWI16748.1 MAG: aspartate ammonia-lyase [Mesorhizobium sp.]RWN08761.1 MAG: aspartate ammonia-lyase [Mesorhizobium sp.]RWN16186.1 MAG: aspartate ammonia-lyase [Mesorhizobium sp.]TIQ97512.1 MAG: aspartate ammonia-lyase [Mesorhizobium sp.]